MLLNIKRKWRDDRNLKNYYKLITLFGFQVILFAMLTYAINIGPFSNPRFIPQYSEFPFVNMVTKYICSIILHMTL